MRKAWSFFRCFKVWKLDILSIKNNFWWKMVGVRGFEPPTPSSRTRCATSLRYTPTNWCWRAYTVMTDFSQVFFKKTRSTIIHFVSVSPPPWFAITFSRSVFLPFPLLSPRATAFYYLELVTFPQKHEIFPVVRGFVALKCFLPTSGNFCCKFDWYFLSPQF